MSVDLFDLSILSQLDCDARQSYAKIGKKINRSKQFVAHRIKILEKEGLIEEYVADANLRAIGYTIFNIFLQFQKMDKIKEVRILNYLKNSSHVGYFLKTLGNWDYFVSVKSDGIKDFYNFLRELHGVCSGTIKKESINLEIQGSDTNLKFLNNTKEKKYCIFPSDNQEKIFFEENERKVFDIIRKNPLSTYFEISEQTGKAYDTIRKIFKSLKEKNLLRRIRARVNTEKLGYERYLFLIELNSLENIHLNKITIYLKNHLNVDYIIECVGSWNIICNVYSKNLRELISVIDDLKGNFNESIYSIEFLRVIQSEKEVFKL